MNSQHDLIWSMHAIYYIDLWLNTPKPPANRGDDDNSQVFMTLLSCSGLCVCVCVFHSPCPRASCVASGRSQRAPAQPAAHEHAAVEFTTTHVPCGHTRFSNLYQ